MKSAINIVSTGISIALLSIQAFGQAPMKPLEQGGKMPGQPLDTASVPREVRMIYITEYPTINTTEWYGYPAYMDQNEWYVLDSTNYNNDQTSENFVSSFSKDDVKHKTVYHKSGKKIATHRHMKNAAFPMEVTNAFNKSPYKSWNVKGDKVEIIKEADKTKVYKICVWKGKDKHDLYFDSKGKMIKDKTMKM